MNIKAAATSRQHGARIPPNCDELEEDIGRPDDLHHESEEVAQPELVVLEGVGGDGVRATEVKQEERSPERHELVSA